ncbi:MAG: DUF808 domain-containing protein [Ancrocorticia sp.]
MPSGLFALLDDIATLAKAAASSIDDVAAGAMKASAKSTGVIIDDAAVTPQYVSGLTPARELPVIWRIARGSLINKFAIIIPAAMVLSVFAPGVFPWLLLVGGSYLSYEGALKVAAWLGWSAGHHDHTQLVSSEKESSSNEQENRIVRSAITTDLVLSTEIMLIAMAGIDEPNVVSRLLILIIVALLMTGLVYGVVAVLVKLDDVGLGLAKSHKQGLARFGRGLAKSMPSVFNVIGVIGTIAMLWVGGHLVASSLADIGVPWLHDFAHLLAHAGSGLGGFGEWLGDTLASFLIGLAWGGIITLVTIPVSRLLAARKHRRA